MVSLRGIVKAANASAEIKNAFGVGTRINPVVGSVSSAVKTIITAYSLYKQWSNSVGIIDKDIEELTAMEASLYSADEKQEKNKYARKAATADKNTLHRAVEDEITRISALGVQEFEISKPAVAKQFADLIPSASAKTKKADTQTAVK